MLDPEDIQFVLRNISIQLALVPTAELAAWVETCRGDLSRADSVGWLLDPTGYRNALQSGQLDDARAQLQIAEHLLAARKAIDERKKLVAEASIRRMKAPDDRRLP